MMRLLLMGWLVAGLMLLTSGCGTYLAPSAVNGGERETAPPVKVTLWAQETKDPRQTVLQETIRTFNESHERVQIVPYFYETEAYKNKLRVAMVSGNMPDVFYYWTGEGFKQMVESKVVADLTPLLKQAPELESQFVPEALESSTFDGSIYGLPNAVSHVLFWYNRTLFEAQHLQVPTSWDQLLEIVQTLSSRHITPISVAGKERWPLLHWFAYLSQRLGGEEPFERVLTRDGDFTDPSFVEAGLRFHELVKKKAFPSSFLGMDINEAEKSFLSGQTAMYLQGDWAAGKLLDTVTQRDPIGYFPFPVMKAGGNKPETGSGEEPQREKENAGTRPKTGESASFYGGYATGFAVSANSDKQAAFEVLAFMMSREQRQMFTEATGIQSPMRGLPVSKPDTQPEIYHYIERMQQQPPTGYFGYYDQRLDPARAQQLLDAVVTFAGEEDMKREDVEAVLAHIR
ncbi:ABC transporter substrate-binding protein [Paenibacillus sp. TAB 01]|uniref:ABC transporter substrate-binding protein n=1 Tax=Paenibacillus sp. TAB 01 TaxID=3368988 RepID=UPI003753CFDF